MLRILKKNPEPTATLEAPPQDWQERAYQKYLRKVTFHYSYENLRMQPLIGFYKHMARKADKQGADLWEEQPLMLNMPDTIVFGEGDGPMWFYTDKDGRVRRKDNFSLEKLVNHLSKGHDDSDVIAVVKKPEGEGSGNASQPVNRNELYKLVMSGTSGRFVVQRYVRSRGGRASIARCVWKADKPPSVWVITNKVCIHSGRCEFNDTTGEI